MHPGFVAAAWSSRIAELSGPARPAEADELGAMIDRIVSAGTGNVHGTALVVSGGLAVAGPGDGRDPHSGSVPTVVIDRVVVHGTKHDGVETDCPAGGILVARSDTLMLATHKLRVR